jgi:hypothetical protein
MTTVSGIASDVLDIAGDCIATALASGAYDNDFEEFYGDLMASISRHLRRIKRTRLPVLHGQLTELYQRLEASARVDEDEDA